MSYAAVKITRFRKRVYEEQHEQIVLEALLPVRTEHDGRKSPTE